MQALLEWAGGLVAAGTLLFMVYSALALRRSRAADTAHTPPDRDQETSEKTSDAPGPGADSSLQGVDVGIPVNRVSKWEILFEGYEGDVAYTKWFRDVAVELIRNSWSDFVFALEKQPSPGGLSVLVGESTQAAADHMLKEKQRLQASLIWQGKAVILRHPLGQRKYMFSLNIYIGGGPVTILAGGVRRLIPAGTTVSIAENHRIVPA